MGTIPFLKGGIPGIPESLVKTGLPFYNIRNITGSVINNPG